MHSRVDPSPPLREQDLPLVRSDCMRDSVRIELGLERRKVLHQECSQESIFAKREQVLLVQGGDDWLRVLLNDPVRDDDRPALVGCADTIERETAGKTGHGTEQALEGLR